MYDLVLCLMACTLRDLDDFISSLGKVSINFSDVSYRNLVPRTLDDVNTNTYEGQDFPLRFDHCTKRICVYYVGQMGIR